MLPRRLRPIFFTNEENAGTEYNSVRRDLAASLQGMTFGIDALDAAEKIGIHGVHARGGGVIHRHYLDGY